VNPDDTLLMRRIRAELVDDEVPLPVDGPMGHVLVRALAHARRPNVHEGRVPRYGAVVAEEPVDWDAVPGVVELVDAPEDLDVARRFADGRGSFLVVEPGHTYLACFGDTVEYEASVVALAAATGGVVVQRTVKGTVRVCTETGVVEWDGVMWRFKPLAHRYASIVRRLVPQADAGVLAGTLELAVHWLSAGHVGGILVWDVLGGATPLRGLDLTSATPGPRLRVDDRAHRAALLSVAGQLDRAIVIGDDGVVTAYGATIVPSSHAERVVESVHGTRHTSARRLSFDESRTLVVTVSEDGPVTVFSDGAAIAHVRADPCRSGFPMADLHETADVRCERELGCPACGRTLLLDVVHFEGWRGAPLAIACPACGAAQDVDEYRVAVRGIRKRLLG
jgi:hypothetical protein